MRGEIRHHQEYGMLSNRTSILYIGEKVVTERSWSIKLPGSILDFIHHFLSIYKKRGERREPRGGQSPPKTPLKMWPL